MTADAHDLLDRYRAAMITMNADDLAELYEQDAVHELPFTFPGIPDRHVGREAIRAAYRAAWGGSDAVPETVVPIATHTVVGGRTLVVEQEVTGHMARTGEPFAFPGILVLTAGDSGISHVRDYMDGLGVAHASGRLRAVADAMSAT